MTLTSGTTGRPKAVKREPVAPEHQKAYGDLVDQWFGNPTATFKAAFHAVPTPDHFEELLETHLSSLIRSELPQFLTDEGEPRSSTNQYGQFHTVEVWNDRVCHLKCARGRIPQRK